MKFLIPLLLVFVAFAGCAQEAPEPVPEETIVERDSFQFTAGEGAIAGLLVDDRFRPIDLETEAAAEFQAVGFLLIQETGQQLRTNENGEFQVLNLEPGTYTIRLDSDRHEATPLKVQVSAGEFAEASLVARRISSVGSAILTTEYSVFAFCAANVLLPLTDFCNLLDLSGDSGRVFLDADYTAYNGTMTALVTEFKANQEGDYYILMGHSLADLGGSPTYYLNEYVSGTQTKCINRINETADPCLDTNLGDPFQVDVQLEYILYINGMYDEEINEILLGLPFTGVGASLAVQGTFLLSAFLGEPETDLETYCTIAC